MAAGDIDIIPLSGSTDGIPITIAPLANVTIHTATAVADELDIIWLYSGGGVSSTILTMEWGGSGTNDKVDYGGPFALGEVSMMIAGFPLRGGLVIKCLNNNTGDATVITGVVHRYYGVTTSPLAGQASILPLSASTNGRPINIPSTSTTTVHTATSVSDEIDLVTLYAVTTGADPVADMGLDFGGVEIPFTLSGASREFVLLADKFPMRNGGVVAVNSDVSTVNIIGYVERYNNG